MILRTEIVEQRIDRERKAILVKEVVMTPGEPALGMVRKRLPPPSPRRGTVLLVHGFAQNRYSFHISGRSFSSYLAAEGWDVFNVDLRGVGRSRRFSEAHPETMEDYIRSDVPECAREAMRLSGHDEVFLIGHSMGGIIGYGVSAGALGEHVRGLVTIGSPYHFGIGSRTMWATAALLGALRRAGLSDKNFPVPLRFVGRHVLKRSRFVWDLRALPTPIRPWSPGSVEDDVLQEYLTHAFDWTSLQVAFDLIRSGRRGVMQGRGSEDYSAAFEARDLPVLVIAGTRDTLAPPPSVRPAYDQSRSSDKTLRVFPLGHIDLIVGREAPTTTWPLIASWLARR